MPFPDYDFADTATGNLNPGDLHLEVVRAGPYSTTFQGVTADDVAQTFVTSFDAAPSAPDQATVDGVVAAHQGLAPGSTPTVVTDTSMTVEAPTRSVLVKGLTAPRVITLPFAARYPMGARILVSGDGSVGPINTFTVSLQVGDLGPGVIVNSSFGAVEYITDGVDTWQIA